MPLFNGCFGPRWTTGTITFVNYCELSMPKLHNPISIADGENRLHWLVNHKIWLFLFSWYRKAQTFTILMGTCRPSFLPTQSAFWHQPGNWCWIRNFGRHLTSKLSADINCALSNQRSPTSSLFKSGNCPAYVFMQANLFPASVFKFIRYNPIKSSKCVFKTVAIHL